MLWFFLEPDFWEWALPVVLGIGIYGGGYFHGHRSGYKCKEGEVCETSA